MSSKQAVSGVFPPLPSITLDAFLTLESFGIQREPSIPSAFKLHRLNPCREVCN